MKQAIEELQAAKRGFERVLGEKDPKSVEASTLLANCRNALKSMETVQAVDDLFGPKGPKTAKGMLSRVPSKEKRDVREMRKTREAELAKAKEEFVAKAELI